MTRSSANCVPFAQPCSTVTCVASDQFDVTTRLESIRSPVLVVCGTNDQLSPRRYSESLAGQIPGAALQTIDGAGHLVMLEQPRRVSGLLSVFLKGIPYQPGL